MRQVKRSKQFDKDVKLMMKRGKKIQKLKTVVELLISNKPLPEKYHDHRLRMVGQVRELHIEPDWLLVYELPKNELHLRRTGSHSDLFGSIRIYSDLFG